MKCKRCGWPMSNWQRDLFSRLCDQCQRIDRAMPGLDPELAAHHALYARAIELLNQGESPEAVERTMITNGVGPQVAASMLQEIGAQRAVYARAAELLGEGLSLQAILAKLVESGLDQQTARAVVNEALDAQRRAAAEQQQGAGSVALMVLGGLVFLVGIGVFLGNITGLFPTLPFAGFLLMTVGGALLGAAGRAG